MKVITEFFIGLFLVPCAAAYLFFTLFGLILGRAPGGLDIENPGQAILAAFLSLLVTIWVTIPGTILSMLLIREEFYFKNTWVLMILGGGYGALLGFMITRGHVKTEYAPFLVTEGFLFGILHVYLFKCLHRNKK
jgi:hypothetical protein